MRSSLNTHGIYPVGQPPYASVSRPTRLSMICVEKPTIPLDIISGKADSPPASKAVLGGSQCHAHLGATFCTPWMFVRVTPPNDPHSRTTSAASRKLGKPEKNLFGSRTTCSECTSRLNSPSNLLCASALKTHPLCASSLKGGYRDFSRR